MGGGVVHPPSSFARLTSSHALGRSARRPDRARGRNLRTSRVRRSPASRAASSTGSSSLAAQRLGRLGDRADGDDEDTRPVGMDRQETAAVARTLADQLGRPARIRAVGLGGGLVDQLGRDRCRRPAAIGAGPSVPAGIPGLCGGGQFGLGGRCGADRGGAVGSVGPKRAGCVVRCRGRWSVGWRRLRPRPRGRPRRPATSGGRMPLAATIAAFEAGSKGPSGTRPGWPRTSSGACYCGAAAAPSVLSGSAGSDRGRAARAAWSMSSPRRIPAWRLLVGALLLYDWLCGMMG